MLRIRPDNGTIRELNIPKEKLEVLEKVVSSPQTTDEVKKLMIKKFAEVSPCCICGGIPSLEVVYDVEFASRVNGTVKHVLIGYSVAMRSSKSKQEHYNKNYHLIRYQGQDRDIRILKSHCDLCNDELPKEADNIQYRINVLDEIDDSFESEYDKHEPRLLLCSSCSMEYNIPSYCA